MKMKICYTGPLGRTHHTERWMRYFAEAGHEVYLISSGELSGDDIGNVKLHKLKGFSPQIRIISFLLNFIPFMIQFKRLIKNINPEIIHAQCITNITLLGAISGLHPFVVTAWGSDVLIASKKSKISYRVEGILWPMF